MKPSLSVDPGRIEHLRKVKSNASALVSEIFSALAEYQSRRAALEEVISSCEASEDDGELHRSLEDLAEINAQISALDAERQSQKELLASTSQIISNCEKYMEKANGNDRT